MCVFYRWKGKGGWALVKVKETSCVYFGGELVRKVVFFVKPRTQFYSYSFLCFESEKHAGHIHIDVIILSLWCHHDVVIASGSRYVWRRGGNGQSSDLYGGPRHHQGQGRDPTWRMSRWQGLQCQGQSVASQFHFIGYFLARDEMQKPTG